MSENRNGELSAVEGSGQRRNGVHAIASYLRRAIETGVYEEGDRLPPERQLAQTFGAARSTVRRALDQLEQAGLVSRRLGSGTYVGPAGPAPRSAELSNRISPMQLIEARLAVEPYTTRLAVEHATPSNLEEIEAVLQQAEAALQDKDGFSRFDGEFHLLIALASGNPLLITLYRQINQARLHDQWTEMKEKILTPDVIADYHRQHRGIFSALHERDAEAAQQRIIDHLKRAKDDLLKASDA
jgi:DNA-binding FadR family transcriptional regulator